MNKLVEHVIIAHPGKVWNQIVSRSLFQTEHPISLTGLTAGPDIFHFAKSLTIVQTSEIVEGKAAIAGNYLEALQASATFSILLHCFCFKPPQSQLRVAKFKINTQVINGTVLRVVVRSACRVPIPLNTGGCSLLAL